MTFVRGATVVVIALLLCVSAAQAQSMFRGDPAHSGKTASQAPREFHRVKWKFPTGDRIVSSPVWENKVLYFGGDDGNIYAVDSESGRQIWKRTTGGPGPPHSGGRQRNRLRDQLRRKILRARAIFSTPLVMNNVVYFGSTDGNLYAIE